MTDQEHQPQAYLGVGPTGEQIPVPAGPGIPEHPVQLASTPPPAIEIRRYNSVEAFQVDAAQMAAAGWHVVTQSEASAGMNGSWVGVAIIAGLVALFLYWPAVVVAVLVLILAAVNGKKQFVVTYRPQALVSRD